MLTPPTGLLEADVEEVIEREWGIAVASLDYRPVGFGSHHWVATEPLGRRHFVTVDELGPDSRIGDEVSALGLHLRPALIAATDLRTIGCRFVVAPVTTRDGSPFVQFGRFSLALYPFVEGQGFSPEEPFRPAGRERVLEMVVALHRVPISAVRPPPVDEFVVPWLDQLERWMHGDGEGRGKGPYTGVASRLLVDNEAHIRNLGARYQALVGRYLGRPGPVVVTHGEIHLGNVMVTSEGWVIVDWDTALLAPPERDLWRLAQGDGSVLRAYEDATGTAPADWLVDLYRIRWDLAEISSFAAEFRAPHEDTDDTRKALAILRSVVGRLRA